MSLRMYITRTSVNCATAVSSHHQKQASKAYLQRDYTHLPLRLGTL